MDTDLFSAETTEKCPKGIKVVSAIIGENLRLKSLCTLRLGMENFVEVVLLKI